MTEPQSADGCPATAPVRCASDSEDGITTRDAVDLHALRNCVTGLRDRLADAQDELEEARRQEAAARPVTLAARPPGEFPPDATRRASMRLRLARLWHRSHHAFDAASVRVTPRWLAPWVRRNPLFDGAWYEARYSDVHALGMSPERHYRRYGVDEGRDPNPFFETSWYVSRYPDVAASSLNPLDHYHLHGAADLRDPSPRFDTAWYLSSNPDVRALGVDPLLHFLRHGQAEGRAPRPRGGALVGATALIRPPAFPAARPGRSGRTSRYSSVDARIDAIPGDRPIALMVEDKFPRTDRDAGSVLTWHHIKFFDGLGYQVIFVATHEDHEQGRYREALTSEGVIALDVTSDRSALCQLLERHGTRMAVAFLARVHAGGAFIEEVRRTCTKVRIIFHTQDLHFLREERAARIMGDRVGLYSAAAVRERELHVARLADATIVVSSDEQRVLEGFVPGADVYWHPLVQEVVGRTRSFQARSGVAFIGGYRHLPNIDAVVHFLDDIWPRVKEALPRAAFFAIGADMPSELRRRSDPGFVAVGHVADLTARLEQVRLTVAPLRFGAGVKGKVVTSLAHGVPCVATTLAAEGMGGKVGGLTIGDTPEAFADAIVQLHEDPEFWEGQSQASILWAMENVSVALGRERFSHLLTNLDLPATATDTPMAQ